MVKLKLQYLTPLIKLKKPCNILLKYWGKNRIIEKSKIMIIRLKDLCKRLNCLEGGK